MTPQQPYSELDYYVQSILLTSCLPGPIGGGCHPSSPPIIWFQSCKCIAQKTHDAGTPANDYHCHPTGQESHLQILSRSSHLLIS
uniref:Uncharacterized protein n=1 Tax=Arundo donax TaxID=35708 RepID=A0A0A9H5P7_ARUDO